MPQTITVVPASPGIFTSSGTGKGQGEIIIATGGEVAAPGGSLPGRPARPANRSEVISIYCTGLGDITNRPPLGAPASTNPLSETLVKATVTIGGMPASVSFSALAPFFAGLYQINAQVPDNAPPGDAVPVQIAVGGAASNTVTMAVR